LVGAIHQGWAAGGLSVLNVGCVTMADPETSNIGYASIPTHCSQWQRTKSRLQGGKRCCRVAANLVGGDNGDAVCGDAAKGSTNFGQEHHLLPPLDMMHSKWEGHTIYKHELHLQ
jgi:hypothetical protein